MRDGVVRNLLAHFGSPARRGHARRLLARGLGKLARAPQSVSNRLWQAIVTSVSQLTHNLLPICVLGALAFPVYYVVWQYIFPQPYENLSLRIVGSLLLVAVYAAYRRPEALGKWFPILACIAIVYCSPFFFTFMLLKNDMSMIWGMSMMAAVLLLVILVSDWLLMLFFYLVGTLLALLAYLATSGGGLDLSAYSEQLPVYVFALLAGAVFNYRRGLLQQERLSGMLAVSRNIAHELRTPLLGIRSGIGGMRRYLPALLEGYELARAARLPVQPVRRQHYAHLTGAMERADNEVDRCNTIIDMLLINSGNPVLRDAELECCSMRRCIENALQRYPFNVAEDYRKVHLQESPDFCFMGSNVLVVHVIFNLLKNALYSIDKAGKGEVFVRTELEGGWGRLFFRDTGCGIKPEDVSRVFERFYSTSGSGAGIGLSFCRMVLEAMGGTIACRSEYGRYAEFVLTLPEVADDQGKP